MLDEGHRIHPNPVLVPNPSSDGSAVERPSGASAFSLASDASISYVQSYCGTPDTLDASLHRRLRMIHFATARIVARRLSIAISWIFASDPSQVMRTFTYRPCRAVNRIDETD